MHQEKGPKKKGVLLFVFIVRDIFNLWRRIDLEWGCNVYVVPVTNRSESHTQVWIFVKRVWVRSAQTAGAKFQFYIDFYALFSCTVVFRRFLKDVGGGENVRKE